MNHAPVRLEDSHAHRAVWPIQPLGKLDRASRGMSVGAPLREDRARTVKEFERGNSSCNERLGTILLRSPRNDAERIVGQSTL